VGTGIRQQHPEGAAFWIEQGLECTGAPKMAPIQVVGLSARLCENVLDDPLTGSN